MILLRLFNKESNTPSSRDENNFIDRITHGQLGDVKHFCKKYPEHVRSKSGLYLACASRSLQEKTVAYFMDELGFKPNDLTYPQNNKKDSETALMAHLIEACRINDGDMTAIAAYKRIALKMKAEGGNVDYQTDPSKNSALMVMAEYAPRWAIAFAVEELGANVLLANTDNKIAGQIAREYIGPGPMAAHEATRRDIGQYLQGKETQAIGAKLAPVNG